MCRVRRKSLLTLTLVKYFDNFILLSGHLLAVCIEDMITSDVFQVRSMALTNWHSCQC